MTVERMPKRSAARPMGMPPKEAPSQASEYASAGTERSPPSSSAIERSPTTVIAGAAKEIAVIANAVTQMTQDPRLSTVGMAAVEMTVEEALVLPDIFEVPEPVAKHPTRGRHRQGGPPRGADRGRDLA